MIYAADIETTQVKWSDDRIVFIVLFFSVFEVAAVQYGFAAQCTDILRNSGAFMAQEDESLHIFTFRDAGCSRNMHGVFESEYGRTHRADQLHKSVFYRLCYLYIDVGV